MAKKELTYDDILKELKEKQYKPIYYLMGEEAYYIDLIADYIAQNVLTDTEKEFNQTIIYGADVDDVATVINAAKRYPMMSEHQVVIVKEAQSIQNIEELSYYLQKPLLSTILVICHKHGTLDRRKKLAAEIEKSGVLFESKKIKDAQLPAFITGYMKRKGIDVEPKSAIMLADYVGSDLSRLVGELDKLIITLPQGQKRVTPDSIEKNIGISKDYNNFELRSALVEKDVLKANQIIKYFEENPKTNPIQVTLSLLFSFYANLMLAYYAPDKSEQGIASQLGLKSPWHSRDYMVAMRKYSGMKVMEIIGEIRYTDAKSKGVGNYSLGNGDLLRELIFKILH
ncbi:MAG: DNA polymerase III subunit delta [Bacteroides sp.]